MLQAVCARLAYVSHYRFAVDYLRMLQVAGVRLLYLRILNLKFHISNNERIEVHMSKCRIRLSLLLNYSTLNFHYSTFVDSLILFSL